jgi:flagellar hook-length control protein FliK
MAVQSRLESAQVNSGWPRTPGDEHQQANPSPFASGLERAAESGGPSASRPDQSVPSQPREFIQQVAERIQIQVQDGKSEIVVQLKPDSLGRLEIRAETTNNGVVARITTESSNVKSYLENNLHLLQQTLQAQGLKVDRIHVVVQDGFNSRSSSGYNAQTGHTGSGRNEGEPRKPSAVSEPMAADQEQMTADPSTWIGLSPNSSFHTVA